MWISRSLKYLKPTNDFAFLGVPGKKIAKMPATMIVKSPSIFGVVRW
jgi:hypothetical protein